MSENSPEDALQIFLQSPKWHRSMSFNVSPTVQSPKMFCFWWYKTDPHMWEPGTREMFWLKNHLNNELLQMNFLLVDESMNHFNSTTHVHLTLKEQKLSSGRDTRGQRSDLELRGFSIWLMDTSAEHMPAVPRVSGLKKRSRCCFQSRPDWLQYRILEPTLSSWYQAAK